MSARSALATTTQVTPELSSSVFFVICADLAIECKLDYATGSAYFRLRNFTDTVLGG